MDRVTKIVPEGKQFTVLTKDGKRYEARALVIATGAQPKRLDVPGEKRLIGRGLSYSAISHAQLCIEREAALVGSSTRALSAAAELATVAKRVHLILPDAGEIESPLGKKLRANPRVTLYENTVLKCAATSSSKASSWATKVGRRKSAWMGCSSKWGLRPVRHLPPT